MQPHHNQYPNYKPSASNGLPPTPTTPRRTQGNTNYNPYAGYGDPNTPTPAGRMQPRMLATSPQTYAQTQPSSNSGPVTLYEQINNLSPHTSEHASTFIQVPYIHLRFDYHHQYQLACIPSSAMQHCAPPAGHAWCVCEHCLRRSGGEGRIITFKSWDEHNPGQRRPGRHPSPGTIPADALHALSAMNASRSQWQQSQYRQPQPATSSASVQAPPSRQSRPPELLASSPQTSRHAMPASRHTTPAAHDVGEQLDVLQGEQASSEEHEDPLGTRQQTPRESQSPCEQQNVFIFEELREHEQEEEDEQEWELVAQEEFEDEGDVEGGGLDDDEREDETQQQQQADELPGSQDSQRSVALGTTNPANVSRTPLGPHVTQGFNEEDEEAAVENTVVDDVRSSQDFVNLLQEARIDNTTHHKMSTAARQRLQNPPRTLINLDEDRDKHLSLELGLRNWTDSDYRAVCRILERELPGMQMYSKYRVDKELERLTGIEGIEDDMCVNTCLAYTGPHRDLTCCPKCDTPRYNSQKSTTRKKVPQRKFVTLPVTAGLARQPDRDALNTFDDYIKGKRYLQAVVDKKIKPEDSVLMFSIDGAQLYESKQSDCWIYIWVLMDLAPNQRYKKRFVLPGAVIPGPNKPKDLDSFLFPGLYHLSAIQHEGLKVFDGGLQTIRDDHPFLFVETADGPGMALMTALVGYHGRLGCRLYCGFPGRHIPRKPHYYPALQLPFNYNQNGCDHATCQPHDLPHAGADDYMSNLARVVNAPTLSGYRNARKQTGISRPTIFLGISTSHTFPVPHAFGSDIMHVTAINVGDELIPLWRGKFYHDEHDHEPWAWTQLKSTRVWNAHGQLVQDLATHLPGSFDRPPRNPALKINSGYKAWEWLLYLYGMAPALLFGVLRDEYWANFCQLVRGVRLLQQHSISLEQVQEAGQRLNSFAYDFETLYVQQNPYRLHMVRSWFHALLHMPRETIQKGPPVSSSQWTMERTISDLGRELRSDTFPYANLANRAKRRAQANCLAAMFPVQLEGYILLGRRDNIKRPITGPEVDALTTALAEHSVTLTVNPQLQRWARLRLPNDQIARSAWKENRMSGNLRRARNVMIQLPNEAEPSYAEVQYYFRLSVNNQPKTFAMVYMYGSPDPDLRRRSWETVHACEYLGPNDVRVIDGWL
ncbi:hypothetical protein CONPUDRAFT_155298 [Coniophora puteana RWD-64-598 SS2]|uniref:Uncharacterized protein n=1 Tax=Coniophora puteana (strain RWD-64-598) TaxID=741705 RepID=A0A5M3MKZ5_CONPW|nr:uncharacterized protein CONPUDRAFT_155298 [Coniophora puteana RWD-64-598 SS2]EIW79902.1 hypothetical protein CONPUDRAFT_155298 [Coniophora puteana RWD-64-598 SS2]